MIYESNKINIAIDGYSSCGKSTLAKQLAAELEYTFIDSGAMYRGITLFALNNNMVSAGKVDEQRLISHLPDIDLKFVFNPETKTQMIQLNGDFVESDIRSPRVSSSVSLIARIKAVREKLVEMQRKLGENGGIVMDGRDIGSVVFPNAELKLFVTASTEVRVARRHLEMRNNGVTITAQAVKDNLLQRDLIDTTRKESPLTQTEDAIVIDNTNLSRKQQLQKALELVEQTLKKSV